MAKWGRSRQEIIAAGLDKAEWGLSSEGGQMYFRQDGIGELSVRQFKIIRKWKFIEVSQDSYTFFTFLKEALKLGCHEDNIIRMVAETRLEFAIKGCLKKMGITKKKIVWIEEGDVKMELTHKGKLLRLKPDIDQV